MSNYLDSTGLTQILNAIKLKVAFKTEIPTKVSDLENDSGFLSSIPDTIATKKYVDDNFQSSSTLSTAVQNIVTAQYIINLIEDGSNIEY